MRVKRGGQMQINWANTDRKQDGGFVGQKAEIMQKVNATTRKKIYASKIAALADRKMPLNLLKIMCQDVPLATDNIHTPGGRRSYVRKCLRYYQGMLRAIERSERKGFFRLFS